MASFSTPSSSVAGRATLVSHGGWVGSWELWQLPFELMHGQWRCIGFDHRGSGVSTCPTARSVAEGVASAIPGAELVVLADTGHVPTFTRPRDVVRAIESWAQRW